MKKRSQAGTGSRPSRPEQSDSYIVKFASAVMTGLVLAQGHWAKGAIPPLDGEGRRQGAFRKS
jgi:hypothetical protein